jgi:cation transport ATPase
VEAGDVVVVRPGEKKSGDFVIGATINKFGTFKFEATKVGKDTALSQIIKMIEDAQGSKAPIQKIADQVSEKSSEHSLGVAIFEHGKKELGSIADPEKFEAIPGRGAMAFVDNMEIFLGTRKLMTENSIDIDNIESTITMLEDEGKTPKRQLKICRRWVLKYL